MFKKSLSLARKANNKKFLQAGKSKKFYANDISVLDLPLTTYFSGTPEPVTKSASNEVLHTERQYHKTKLKNGLRVHSSDYNQCGTTVISLVVSAGSRYEDYHTSGISHFIQKFFFDTTNTRSKMRLVSEMQKTGGTVSCSSDREYIIYRTESVREAVPKLLTLMSDSVLQGRLHEWDLHPQRELVEQDLKDYAESPDILLNEALHKTAFNGKVLGNPLICPSYNLNKITIDDIVERMDTYYNPCRIQLFGTNINHDDLVYLANHFFGEFPEGTGTNEGLQKIEKSEYSGGDFQMHQTRYRLTDPGTQSVLAFRGVSTTDRDVFALQVLKNILGESKSHNLRNPTTYGTQSLLNNKISKTISKSAGKIQEASAFSINYFDDGLFGIKFAGDSAAVGEAIGKSYDLLKKIAKDGVCEENFYRGQSKTLFNYLSSLETSVGEHEAFLTYPILQSIQLADGIVEVTPEHVQRAAKKLISEKPTLVSYGELANVPKLFDLTK